MCIYVYIHICLHTYTYIYIYIYIQICACRYADIAESEASMVPCVQRLQDLKRAVQHVLAFRRVVSGFPSPSIRQPQGLLESTRGAVNRVLSMPKQVLSALLMLMTSPQ